MFKTIFTSKRVVKAVADIRKLLRALNIEFTIPHPDPFRETIFNQAKAERAIRHQQLLVSNYLQKQEKFARLALETQKALDLATSKVEAAQQDDPPAAPPASSPAPTPKPLPPIPIAKRPRSSNRQFSPRKKVAIRDVPPAPGSSNNPAPAAVHTERVERVEKVFLSWEEKMVQEEQEETLLLKKRVEITTETRSVSWVNMVEEDEAEEAKIAQQVEGLKIISPQEEEEIQVIHEIGNIKIADDQKPQVPAPSPAKQAPGRSRPRNSKGKYVDFKLVPLRLPGQLPPIKDFITPPVGPVLEPKVFTAEMREVAESVYHSHLENEYQNYDNDTLKGRDLLTLKPPNWLNDTVISAYLYLIQLRSKDRPDLPKVFRYPAFFTNQLLVVGYPDMTDGWLGT